MAASTFALIHGAGDVGWSWHLVADALRERGHHVLTGASSAAPWPLEEQPRIPARILVCADDRFFPVEFLRRVTRERLGLEAEEIPGCHCVALSHPRELAEALTAPARTMRATSMHAHSDLRRPPTEAHTNSERPCCREDPPQ